MRKTVPFLYRYIHGKMREHSRKSVMKPWEFRLLLSQVMRIQKGYCSVVLRELEEMGLVRYDNMKEIIKII